MNAGSPRVTAAAVPSRMAPAAPVVTKAASTPASRAMRSPTRSWSSRRLTKWRAASRQAATTSGGISEPPRLVTVPVALMTRLTPRAS